MIKYISFTKFFLLVLLLVTAFSNPLLAQLNDDFSDGDFTTNPIWTGTEDLFVINEDFQLQLNATEAGTAWLSTAYEAFETMEWRFYIRLAFSPSANNYARVMLSSGQNNPGEAFDGYYLQFGEAGSEDAIELFKQENGEISSILRGTTGQIASSFAFWVKVIRTEQGNWQLLTDPSGTGIYTLEASGFDESMNPGGWFGFFTQYTVSNSTRFYFDDVYAGPEQIDDQAPQLLQTTTLNPFELQLTFDEGIAPESLNPDNFSADNNLGKPAEVSFGENSSIMQLYFETSFENGVLYTLTINNISDLAGNIAPEFSTTFSYYEAATNDVVINEIMADPTPVVGLPEWEYVELYNRTSLPVDLNGWQFLTGTTVKDIGAVTLEPNGYLILCHEDALAELESYGAAFGFSSFQLSNAGTSLSLISKQGTTISMVGYTDKWYNDPNKTDGGWSLEQIDPDNPCGGRNNWSASNATIGGTPGSLNAIDAPNVFPPKVERFQLITDNILHLWFDQQMDPASLQQLNNYTLENNLENPTEAYLNPSDGTFVELVFNQPFLDGNLYKLLLSENLMNCIGLGMEAGSFIQLGLPDMLEAGDILINEILFNPLGDGVDYVEVLNPSDKILDLNQLYLGNIRQTIPNPPDTTLYPVTTDSYLLLPGKLALLCTNGNIVAEQYPISDPEVFVEMNSFPSYPNTEGTAVLMSLTGKLIDKMSYTEKMHFPLLNIVKGVSLERISTTASSDDPDNWHSAAESVGFGTPGLPNSMTMNTTPSTDEISISPEIFSPDGDGVDDATSINYLFDEPGYTMNILIFNSTGQQIRHLVKSELVGSEGQTIWNGLDENGNRVTTGIYIVFAEVFDLNGNTKSFKEAVVVASR
ncbi:MAG: lamin tail domain-containing protein [Bacteroidales bacterium]|nr:lamin tail domain-containing protein [Bacteroidales bacterium]HOI31697.1 lamin tail domain-containing protein [Bacteroidales bacterium]